MISYEGATVLKLLSEREQLTEALIRFDGGAEARAINYPALTGPLEVGDRIIVNTTAVVLNLGSGGYHFVMHNETHQTQPLQGEGHIMKLRYTPFQIRVLSAEEQNSPYHRSFLEFESLAGQPVIACELHSMVLPVVCTLKYCLPQLQIAYVMTEGAALPLAYSRTVAMLKERGLLDRTITIGHAFGGDLECVNLYTGLIAAKEVAKADVTVVAMGPGIVGTGTPYGFSGIEQGLVLNGAHQLGGHAVALPRISFADPRPRHQGISHHSLTILEKIAAYPVTVVLPYLEAAEQRNLVADQINHLKNHQKHNMVVMYRHFLVDALAHYGLPVSTMGRSYQEDPAFFQACGAAAQYTVDYLLACQENESRR